jgi:hypothetical protein
MKASKFSDAQKAFILKQGNDGMPVAEVYHAVIKGIARQEAELEAAAQRKAETDTRWKAKLEARREAQRQAQEAKREAERLEEEALRQREYSVKRAAHWSRLRASAASARHRYSCEVRHRT